MKDSKLQISLSFIAALIMLMFQNSYAQWTITGNLTGISGRPQISIADENNVWAVGGPNGTPGTPVIYKTTNGGLNWISVQTSGIRTNLVAVYARDPNQVFIGDIGIGADGYTRFYKTINGGDTWITIDSILNTGSNGGSGGIKFSSSIPEFGISLVDGPADSVVTVFKTFDAGFTWSKQTVPLFAGADLPYSSLDVVDSLFYSFGSFGVTPRWTYTTNGGATWNSVEVGLDSIGINSGRGVAFSHNKQTGIVGSTSLPLIARTTNGGLNWSNVSLGNFAAATTYGPIIRFIEPNTFYLTAPYTTGGVFKSTNGGTNWSQMTTSNLGIFNFDIKKIGSRIIGYANAQNGEQVLKSTESLLSGKRFFANWTTPTTKLFTKSHLNSSGAYTNFGPGDTVSCGGMEFDNQGTLYCIQSGVNPVLKTLDTTTGILTTLGPITGITTANQNRFVLSYNTVNNTMYMGGYENGFSVQTFLYTLNLNTRAATYIGTGSYNLGDIAINSSGICYGISNSRILLKVNLMTGEQTTINIINYNTNNAIQGLCFDRETDVLYISAWNNDSLRAELRSVNLQNAETRVEAVFTPNFNSRIAGFAIPFSTTVGIQNISSEIPDRFRLNQNYPNPFNPVTKINFNIAVTGFTTLKVYDILGKEVSILVNEKLNAGSYEVDFDGRNLSSGNYFYRLETGGYAETRSMVLLK